MSGLLELETVSTAGQSEGLALLNTAHIVRIYPAATKKAWGTEITAVLQYKGATGIDLLLGNSCITIFTLSSYESVRDAVRKLNKTKMVGYNTDFLSLHNETNITDPDPETTPA